MEPFHQTNAMNMTVLHWPLKSSSSRPIICDSSGCCDKDINDNICVLGSNVSRVDGMNNDFSLNITRDSCMCIPRAYGGPELNRWTMRICSTLSRYLIR